MVVGTDSHDAAAFRGVDFPVWDRRCAVHLHALLNGHCSGALISADIRQLEVVGIIDRDSSNCTLMDAYSRPVGIHDGIEKKAGPEMCALKDERPAI